MKKVKIKTWLAGLLTLAIALSTMAGPAMAAGDVLTGSCGDDVTWTLQDGVLTLSGSGETSRYSASSTSNDRPEFYAYREAITEIVVKSRVTRLGSALFYGLTEVTRATLADTVTGINMYAFYGCTGLKEIDLGDSVNSIGDSAFSRCSSLTTFTIPASVKNIGISAFSSTHITEMTFMGDPPSFNTNALASVSGVAYYPADNANWTASVLSKKYGGSFTWMPLGSTDKDALEAAIVQAGELNEAIYTEDSWNAVQEALASAIVVYDDDAALQAEINEAAEALDQAIRELVYNDADKTLLDTAIREAGELDEIQYTADSWAAVLQALNTAEEVFNDPYASQKSVDAAAESLNAAMEALVLHTHDWAAEVTEPTCTEGGFTTYTCTICGEIEVRDYEEPLGHSWVVSEVTEPTCTEEGFTEYICSACGDTYTGDYEDALGHTWEDPEMMWSEDFSSAVAVRICSVCGESESADAVITTETTRPADGEEDTTVYTATATFDDGVTMIETLTVGSGTENNETDTGGTGTGVPGSSGSGSSEGGDGYLGDTDSRNTGSGSSGSTGSGSSGSTGSGSSGSSDTGDGSSGNGSLGSSRSTSTSPQTGDPFNTTAQWLIAGSFALAGCGALVLYRTGKKKIGDL